jgi:hypothetical protein
MLIEGAHADKIHEEEDGLASWCSCSVRDSPYSGGIGIGAELTRPNVWAVVYRVNQTRNVNTTLSSAEAGVFVQAN